MDKLQIVRVQQCVNRSWWASDDTNSLIAAMKMAGRQCHVPSVFQVSPDVLWPRLCCGFVSWALLSHDVVHLDGCSALEGGTYLWLFVMVVGLSYVTLDKSTIRFFCTVSKKKKIHPVPIDLVDGFIINNQKRVFYMNVFTRIVNLRKIKYNVIIYI